MSSDREELSDEAARAVWRRAAELQAEAERRLDEKRRLPERTRAVRGAGLHPDEIRAAGEEAGISPEFVQIALAEASAGNSSLHAPARHDILGATFFLGAKRHTIDLTTTVPGSVDVVSTAVLQVFSGHPCLLQADEVAELPSWSGRVIVFNIPRYDWSVTANPPFVEKAAMIGLRQLHVAIRPLPLDDPTCEVVVAGDLQAGMRTRWRWSAATSVGATAVGGVAGVGLAGSIAAGAILAVPAVLGAAAVSGAAVGVWAWGYRYYRGAVEKTLEESLRLLLPASRAVAATRGKLDQGPQSRALP